MPPRHTVIIGGGVIGCTTAYFLTRHASYDHTSHRITVLEACAAVAAGASSKAGGMLAMWAHPDPLVALSFRLHAELASEHAGAERWGYRAVGCGAVEAVVGLELAREREAMRERKGGEGEGSERKGEGEGEGSEKTKSEDQVTGTASEDSKAWEKLPKLDAAATDLFYDSPLPRDLDYIDPSCIRTWSKMGATAAESATAQVHPLHFTTAMAELASGAGAAIVTNARVTRIVPSSSSESGSPAAVAAVVEYEDRATGRTVSIDDATDVVVAAGPWTGALLPRSKISGLRAHSVVFSADVSPYAVFTSIRLPPEFVPAHRRREGRRSRKHGGVVDPEIYARPHGEVYVCGEVDPANTTTLPPTADAVPVDPASCTDLAAYVATISPVLAAAPITARQACFIPSHTRFGREVGPLIGETAVRGVWVASGHSCWGIQNAPATGKLVSEMLLEGRAVSAEVDKFDPGRFKV